MIKAIALDDEPLALRVIESHASKIPFLELVHKTTNAVEALLCIQKGDIQLLFLDIQMPDLTGIQFMQLMKGQNCKVILTTAYAQYALEGYEYDVVDYLLKPISFDRFFKSVQKAQQILQPITTQNLNLAIENKPIINIENNSTKQDFVFIKTEYKLQRVQHDDILFIEGGKDYITIHTPKERILSLTPLSKLQEMLPNPTFLRVHKSWLVAINKIDSIERQRIFIGKTIIPVGDTYKEDFMRAIGA